MLYVFIIPADLYSICIVFQMGQEIFSCPCWHIQVPYLFFFSISNIDISADNALKIIEAYKGIVKAIEEANNSSQEAVDKAIEALIDVST